MSVFCPIRNAECLGPNCAWFDPGQERCCIGALGGIYKILEFTARK